MPIVKKVFSIERGKSDDFLYEFRWSFSETVLFGSFVALFITHSALGIGTIVVSGIFNQFVIYAGAVLAGKTNILLKWVFVCLYVYGTSENVHHKFAFNIFSHLNEVCGNELQLNPLIVLREAFFYGLSIAYLLFALSRKEIVDDDVEYEPHIVITVLEGGLLLSGYILYVIVCANFDKNRQLLHTFALVCRTTMRKSR